jgi:hypothetical protein
MFLLAKHPDFQELKPGQLLSYNNVMVTTGFYPKLKFTHLIALRLIFPLVGYFILSVCPTKLPFPRNSHHRVNRHSIAY